MAIPLPRTELLTLSREERSRLRAQLRPSLWAEHVARLRLPKGDPIDFETHGYLRAVYDDLHPNIVVMKGAQMGFSTWAIARSFWMMTTYPSSVVYTFPNQSDVSEFTAARINPLVVTSKYLNERIVDVNSVGLKQFIVADQAEIDWRNSLGRGARSRDAMRSTVYFGGSSSEKDAVAVDADLLVHDEVDLSNPQIIEQFESRLDHSRFKWKIQLSTPRIPGAGVDRLFRETDQRKWFITCGGCNAEYEMAFPGGPWAYSNIEPETHAEVLRGHRPRYVCHRCNRTLTNEDRARGRWMPTVEGPFAHGYTISQMAASWIPAGRVLERKHKATWESDFWNLVMGIAWEEGTTAMTPEAIRLRCGDEPMAQNGRGCTMGVDVGSKFDVVIGTMENGVPRTLHIGRYDSYEDLTKLMDRFAVSTCVIDAAPEEHATRAWANGYNDLEHERVRVWRVYYAGGGGKTPEVTWKPKQGTVTAARTEVLSRSADELLAERILPKYDGSDAWEAYLLHHKNSKKLPVFFEGLETQKVLSHYEWVEVGADHMFHAATYEMLSRMAPRSALPPSVGMISLNRSKDPPQPAQPPILPTSIRPPNLPRR